MIFNPQKQGLMEILDVIASQWMRKESKAKLWVPHSVSNDFQETQNVAIIENSSAPVEALSALVEEIRESQSHIVLLIMCFPVIISNPVHHSMPLTGYYTHLYSI